MRGKQIERQQETKLNSSVVSVYLMTCSQIRNKIMESHEIAIETSEAVQERHTKYSDDNIRQIKLEPNEDI